MATCKLQGIEPGEYLETFMRKMAENPIRKPEELLPGTI
ncbi:MAG: transposase domain-containing protein [Candidatus Riflebacteria bacterium]